MWFRSAIDALQSHSSRTPRRQSARQVPRWRFMARRISIEPLEERRMLSFSPAVDYPVATGPSAIVAADFNADGRLDLATANSGSNMVSVMLGNADGTFQAAQNSGTGTPVSQLSLAVGDFNADGKLDIVTASAANVSVLLGNGNGTFQAPSSINIGSAPSSVAVGDFNGDGKLDLGVTSNTYYPGYSGYYGSYPGSYVGRVNVLLGTGGGSFSAPITSGVSGFLSAATLADFNGDGKLDFATTNYDYGYVLVLPGTGTGNLGSPNYFTAYASRSMAAGDVNGDGKLDLVTGSQNYYYVNVLIGNGLGAFATSQYLVSGSFASFVALGDLNGDGQADIVTANWKDGSVSVLFGAGNGSLTPPVPAAAGAGVAGVALGDFNGDGRMDAATANSGSSSVSVLLNDGTWPTLDAPSITISDATVTEGNTGTVGAVFTVSLSAVYGQPVSVRYATADGSATLAGGDYQAKSGTLTFTPGQTSKTVTVLINGDRIGDGNETFSVLLSNPTNAFVRDATGVGTILDDEPYISTTDYVSGAEGNTGTTPFMFTVTLSAPYDAPVTVDYSTSDLWYDYYGYTSATADVDYVAISGTLTFAAGQTSKTVTVLVIGDRLGEWDEHFLVNLSNPTSANLGFDSALARIVDDEPYASIYNAEVVEGNSGTKALTFDVTLTTAYDVPVTVNFATADGSALAGSDYVASSGTLTFAPGVTSMPLSVMVKGDVLTEQEEYFNVLLTAATNGNIGNYNFAYGTIIDDDTAPAISISDVTRYEGNSGTTSFVFTVSLSTPSDTRVTVNYATANGSAKKGDNDYTAKSGKLTFAPGQTSKTITILVKGDKKNEGDETFFVNLSGARGAELDDGQGLGTILNDDRTGKGGGKGLNQIAFASAVDAAIDNWMTGRPKRRWW
jgi:Calx-beta domain/FG-GAP-like repeat